MNRAQYSVSDYEQLYNEMVESYSICFKGLREANKIAAHRLGLLERLLDQDVIWADPMCGCEDCDLVREVEQELK